MPTSLHSLQFVQRMKKMNRESSWLSWMMWMNCRSRYSTVAWVKVAVVTFLILLSLAWILFIIDPSSSNIKNELLGKDISTNAKQSTDTKAASIHPTAFNQQILVADITKKPNFNPRHKVAESWSKQSSVDNMEQPVSEEIHFIHVPKCGGTSMTAALRAIQCHIDPKRNSDCCRNPGFCDWHANRRCATIKGCINHFPNRYVLFNGKISKH